ncbi:hypothetical protein ACFL28_05365 [Candidatus Omnitrophota bacterium]
MNKKRLPLPILILLLMTAAPLFASTDFEEDYFKEKPKVSPKGSKDNNGDGRTDEMYYKEGNKELLMEDTDYDGRVDRVGYSENGVLFKMEEDIDKDGAWDRRYWYKHGELYWIQKNPSSIYDAAAFHEKENRKWKKVPRSMWMKRTWKRKK